MSAACRIERRGTAAASDSCVINIRTWEGGREAERGMGERALGLGGWEGQYYCVLQNTISTAPWKKKKKVHTSERLCCWLDVVARSRSRKRDEE